MEYRIRELKVSEIRLLRTFLYEAIYQPSNRDKLPVNIIDTPELYLYIKDWGKANDYCLVLEIANPSCIRRTISFCEAVFDKERIWIYK